MLTVCIDPDDLLDRFSSYNQLLRILAWYQRFLTYCRAKNSEKRILDSMLHLSEIGVEIQLLKLQQLRFFQQEISAPTQSKNLPATCIILQCQPFLDSHGLLQVGGRLQQAGLKYAAIHPIILHRKARLSKLLTQQLHRNAHHAW